MLRRIPPVILIVILLAIYGFLVTFISDPINTLIVLGLSVLLFLGVRHFLRTGKFFSRPAVPRKPYQPKPKTNSVRSAGKKPSQPPPRKNHPFRVIDGKKGKGKGKANDKQSDQDSQNNLFQ
ncbi:hypothetical protein [Brevibacillus invocatus]|uniref:Uncharacterized protein n=1 Tax=Brevibacillus invocatus TaxID=173959 RepID=A0A3M8CIT4_9BACL|nr:hypothetical protein [Brevibacillus invocatus]MCM3080237.1 hypothetical protein [Brevibacillus invocatus]MCM3430509.1 hypothetical protein [Brevibacillus invocatus]RNB75493.1 hypothetical protein EDM52_07895 [Brevibacillus invocatus]